MSLYDWKDTYSVGIESIDNDHKGLFNLINQLFEAMRQGKAKEIISEIMLKLSSYIRTHFKREELYFKTTNYPDCETHIQQHEHFIEKINEMKKQLDSGNQKVSVDLIKFLSEWLINHIMISDKKYMAHLKKYGIK